MSKLEDAMREAILSLPQDMKAVLRIVEDPDLDDPHRVMAAGALLHVLSAHNAIPGLTGMVAYVDDVIVLRLMLERLQQGAAEVIAQHEKDSPELFGPLPAQLAVVREHLGALVGPLEKAVAGLPTLSHQGYAARDCVRDEGATWLYDAVHAALVDELDFDEDRVARELKRVNDIVEPLRMRQLSG